MATSRLRSALGVWLLALTAAPWGVCSAAPPGNIGHTSVNRVDDVAVYLSVTPAESMRERFREGSAELKMHGGPPDVPHVHHVMVTLVDETNHQRVTDAHVNARLVVPARHLSSRRKPLQTMRIGDAVSYGNYFAMGVFGTYRITVTVDLAGKPQMQTSFLYDHEHDGHGK